MDFLRALLERHLKAAWRRRWIGVAAAWAVCLAGWTLVAMMPNQYQVSSQLYVDTNAILTPLLAGIAVNTSPQGQLDMLQHTLLSRPNIETLIAKTDLDLTANGPGAQDALIRSLQHGIALGQQGDNLFSISYRNPQPQLALQVVQTLLSIFVERATGTNHLQMENARRFLEHQIASYEQQLRAVETREAEFQSRYFGAFTPGGGGVDVALDTLRGNVSKLENSLQDHKLAAKALQTELAQTRPMLVAEELADAPQTPLGQAEERLRMMKLQYTDVYPGVIALEQQIASMRAEALKQAAAAAGGKVGAGETVAGKGGKGSETSSRGTRSVPNPVYDQIKIKLVDAQAEIASIERQLGMAKAEVGRLERLQQQEPNLVAEYDTMNRDYGVLRHDYDMLLDRLQSANIAEAADTQANKVQIQVIDPPVLPRLPVAPNRLLLVTGVMLAGMGAAVALPLLLAQLDRSFCMVDDLRVLGLPVLGGISLLGSRRLHQTVGVALPVGLAFGVLVVAYCGLVVRILHTSAVI
jgi:polysaccharide chain length determinant protein (PEP-CTERM system associated)